MTARLQKHTGFHMIACGLLTLLAVRHDNYFGALAYLLAAWLPVMVRQKRTALYACAVLVLLAVFMPKTALVLLGALWVGFLCLPKVPVPPTKSEMAELKQAAARSRENQELGNIRVMPSGATYVVDKHGSWRRQG